MLQLDYDEEMRPLHGMYGSMEAEYEVQRTIKRAVLTAFLCLFRKVCGPIKVHVDNKGIIDGLRKGEKECIKPRAGDADLWIKSWEELRELVTRGIFVEVEHVKAHRTKKEKEKMTQFERFVTEGNEKADELAKAVRAETIKQEREEVYAALQYAASFHCLVEQWKDCEELRPKPVEKWIFVGKKSDNMKHRTEWRAEADKYRCMRCGRGSKQMKMPGKMYRTETLDKKLGNMEKAPLERP